MKRPALTGLLLGLLLVAGVAAAAQQVSGQPSNPQTVPNAAQVIYHGNIKSKKFHRPSCRYYNCRNCTARFTSRQEALAAGYIPCKVCRP